MFENPMHILNMHGIFKIEKLFKAIQGWQIFRPKRAAVPFRGHITYSIGTYIRMATFARKKATATRFGLYLRHPWTDFGHFFNFKNPISIFYKIY
jgi:hypothetical protein